MEMQHIHGWPYYRKSVLKKLHHSGVPFGVYRQNALKQIWIDYPNVGDYGAECIFKLRNGNRRLDLHNKTLSLYGVLALLKELETNTTMIRIYFHCQHFGEDKPCPRLAALCKMLKVNTTLRSINLSCIFGGIGSDGAKLIADALRHNNSLSMLVMRGHSIGEEGVEALESAIRANPLVKSPLCAEQRMAVLCVVKCKRYLLRRVPANVMRCILTRYPLRFTRRAWVIK